MKPVHGAAAQALCDEMSVGYLVARARTALLTSLDTELEPFGLTGAQFAVLKNVAEGTAATGDTRLKVAIQFVSHVLPPSPENACSSWNDVVLMSEKMKRVKIPRPSSVSAL